ncbi:MAG: putative 2-aminoethylphosphonate ABC transporter substrate-binding protein [Hyphomicrobiales bacterium]|nr:putative 2-aminoethylphosphonate ABC transporter substrate-binding protein [Hyphomicrobiales bacterium]MCP5374053.1 putative 2-aminoethylphosphonate ABC transporter substrate-binding protein [Hyphomicrobiales bacterium]
MSVYKDSAWFKRAAWAVSAGVLALGLSGMAKATELKVYTAIEADDLKRYAAEFNKVYPDIEIKWVRDSTGIVTAKLLAEKDNPQADVVWGLAATSLMLLKNEGMTQAYMPAGGDKLDKKFIDTANPPHWTGMDAWVACICYNTVEAKKKNLPVPTSWKDLTKPVYKGSVVMPNPNSSGTGFLDVASWLQLFGEEDGWKFMDALHQNIAWYTHSGSKPCRQAGAGEVPIGVSFAYRGAKVKSKGAPVEIIVPKEGIGWDMEATAIMKGTKNLDAAKKLVDFSVSKAANEMYNTVYAVVAYPGVAKPVDNYPPNIGDAMIDNNFEWVAANRMRILKEWQTRYDSKSEAK